MKQIVGIFQNEVLTSENKKQWCIVDKMKSTPNDNVMLLYVWLCGGESNREFASISSPRNLPVDFSFYKPFGPRGEVLVIHRGKWVSLGCYSHSYLFLSEILNAAERLPVLREFVLDNGNQKINKTSLYYLDLKKELSFFTTHIEKLYCDYGDLRFSFGFNYS